MFISGVSIPLVFNIQGNYTLENGKPKSAFNAGTVYFRHGAKSETGTSDDLRQFLEKELKAIRKQWYGNIRKVIEAPLGYNVKMLPSEVKESAQDSAIPIRIVNDPSAPAYRKLDPNVTHPFRQKEVINKVNTIIGQTRRITQYDIQCIRKLYSIEEKDQFFYKPKFASAQYSESFVNWLLQQFQRDNSFFDRARVNEKVS